MTYHENPCPCDHENFNFGRPFEFLPHYYCSLSDLCLGVEKKIYREMHQFYTFCSQLCPLRVGLIKLLNFCLLSLQGLQIKFGKDIGQVVLEKMMP